MDHVKFVEENILEVYCFVKHLQVNLLQNS